MAVGVGEVRLRVVVQGVAQASAQLRSFNKSLSLVGGSRFRTSVGALGGVLGGVRAGFQDAAAGVTNFGRRMTAAGSVISTVGFRMSAMIGIPIVGFLGGATKAAAEFEEELVKTVTLVGITGDEMARLGQEILTVAPQLGAKPVELAAAAYFVLSNGIVDTAKAMEITTLAAKAQAIGLGEADAVAKILTAAVVAYGEENITATQAADQLVAAVQKGSVEADEFAEPLGRMLGLAANLGVSFAEATGFITIFTSSGISASQAVTGLNRVMASFLKPTNKAKDALETIGLTADTALQLLGEQGLARTLSILRAKFEEANVPVSDYIGRVTGLNAALFNTGAAGDRYINTVDEITQANGTLERSFQVVTETTSFQFDQLKASLSVLAITIGSIFLPAINSIIKRLIPLIQAIGEFVKMHPRILLVVAAFGLMALVIGPLVSVIGLFISSIGIIVSALGGLLTVIASVLSGWGLFIAAIVAVAAAIGGLFLASLSKMENGIDLTFSNISEKVGAWGRNIILSLARGMAAGALAVIKVLRQLGNVIARWLSPGSPPKLLPNIDDWGAAAMNEYLKGFTTADFGIFSSISDVVESLFNSLKGSAIPEEGVIPAILGSRSAAAAAIAQFNETGTISSDILDRISGSFGSISQDVRDYIVLLTELRTASIAVEAAQAEIVAINERFANAVKPLNDELKGITDRYEEIKLAQEKQRLEAILDDPRAPALAKELALLGLRELELKAQIAQEEEQRDAALETADAALAAAEAEKARLQAAADAQKALIDAQIKNNDLLNSQLQLMEQLIEKMDELGDLGGDIGEGIGEGIADFLGGGGGDPEGFDVDDLPFDVPSLADIIGEGLAGAAKQIGEDVQGLIDEIKAIFAPVAVEFDKLTTQWAAIFDRLAVDPSGLKKIAEEILGWALALLIWKAVWKTVAIVQAIKNFILVLGGGAGLKAGLLGIAAALTGPLGIALIAAGLAVGALLIKFEGFSGAAEAVRENFTGTGVFGTEGVIILATERIKAHIYTWIANTIESYERWRRDVEEKIATWSANTENTVNTWIDNTIASLLEWDRNTRERVRAWAVDILLKFEGWADDVVGAIIEWKDDMIAEIRDMAEGVLSTMASFAVSWITAGENIIQGFIDGISNKVSSIRSIVRSTAQGIIDLWNSVFDGNSPSRVMFDSAEDVIQGFILGIRASIPELATVMGSAGMTGGQAFVSGTAGTTQANSFAFNTTINNGMDQAIFESRVRRIVAESIG
jgi:TP901 family phage tail tape measure protein